MLVKYPNNMKQKAKFTLKNVKAPPKAEPPASDHPPLDPEKKLPSELEKPYDPHDFGNTHQPISFWGTVFHLVIIVAGPSVLSIPSTFVGAGYLTSLILMPFLFALYIHNVNMVMWCEYQLCQTKRIPTLSYPQVAYYAFKDGPAAYQWLARWSRGLAYVDFTMVWFSYYCYNYVIVCQNLQVLVGNILHVQISVTSLVAMLLVPLLLLACIPKLKYLVPFSLCGSVCNVIVMLFIIYFIICDPTPWKIPVTFGQFPNMSLFVGSVLANLNIMGPMISLKNEMKKPKQFATGFGAVLVSYSFAALVYSAFSLICALKYGDTILPSVIENLPPQNPMAQVGISVASLAIMCQQPLLLHVPYDIIWNQLLKKKINTNSTIWEYFLRLLLVILTFVLSSVVPNAFVYLSISGTIGTSIDSLILPAVIHTAVVKRFTQSKLKFWLIFIKNMAIIALAVVLVIYGSIDSIQEIMQYYSDE